MPTKLRASARRVSTLAQPSLQLCERLGVEWGEGVELFVGQMFDVKV